MTSTISCFKRIWRKKSKLRGAELWKAEFLAADKTCSVIFWSTPSFRERPIDVWILKRAYFHFGIHITLIIMRSWLFRRFIQPCHKVHWRGWAILESPQSILQSFGIHHTPGFLPVQGHYPGSSARWEAACLPRAPAHLCPSRHADLRHGGW